MGKLFKSYTAEQKEGFCQDWKKSGLSQSQYCREKGLKVMTFNGWVKKFLQEGLGCVEQKNQSKQAKKFIPLSVSDKGFKEAEAIEIKIPGKMIITIPITSQVRLIEMIIKEASRCI